MKKLLLSFLCCMLAVIGMQAETATLSFADKAQRTSYTTDKQVWEQNGITFTNNKSSSTNNVADYANPVRLYANSEIVIEFGHNMTEIQFTCSSSSYATALGNSINVDASVSVDAAVVTATLTNPSTSFTIARLGAQVRLSSITVTYSTTGSETPGEGGEDPVEPTPDPEEPVEPTPDPEDPVEPTPEGKTVVFDATQQGYANGVAIESVDIASGIVATFDKGSNSNAPKYYTSGTAIRCYGGNNFTIASTVGNITKVVLTYGEDDGSNDIITDCGTFATNTWTGESTSVKFTVDGSKGNRRIQKIAVTYKAEEGVVLPPTFDPADGMEFVESMDVTIEPASNDLSVYYSFVENGEYVEYTQPITITETTTVYAYAKMLKINKAM